VVFGVKMALGINVRHDAGGLRRVDCCIHLDYFERHTEAKLESRTLLSHIGAVFRPYDGYEER
jgi:hypothetical protein